MRRELHPTPEEVQRFLHANTYHCSRLNAYVTKEQCQKNKRRGQGREMHPALKYHEFMYEKCHGCPGIGGPAKSKEGKGITITCSWCRRPKPESEYETNKKTGKTYRVCEQCRAKRVKNTRPVSRSDSAKPFITLSKDTRQIFASAHAIQEYQLQRYSYVAVIIQNGEMWLKFLHAKDGSRYCFRLSRKAYSGSPVISVNFRSVSKDLGLTGPQRYILEPGEDKRTVRLRKAN